MKNYDNFNFEEELRPLLENYLSAANFIARTKTGRDKMIFHDLRVNENIFYYNQKYEKMLSNILDEILNPFIEKIFKYQGLEYRFCNHINRKEAFEFAFIKDDIGYVVTYDYNIVDEDTLLSVTNTSKILNVKNDNFKDEYVILGEKTDTLSLKYFFKYCLGVPEEKYNKMVVSISDTYEEANKKISVSVKRKISDYSIDEYRNILRQDLYKKYYFNIVNLNKDLVYYDGKDFSKKVVLQNKDIVSIAGRFRAVYSSLCSDKDYSVSFVTAEYLYGLFEEGMCIDYTPIILGYVKALEQLYRLISNFYKLKNKTPGNMKPTFGTYVNSICQNLDTISFKDPIIKSRLSKTEISLQKMLESFNKNARCDFIHKVNISDKEIVGRIRNNARVLIFLTVGGLFKGIDLETVKKILGDDTNYKYNKFCDFISKADAKREFIRFHCPGEGKKINHCGKIIDVTSESVLIEDNESKKVYTFNESYFPYKYEYVVEFFGKNKDIYGDISESNELAKTFKDFTPKQKIEDIYKVDAYFSYIPEEYEGMTQDEWTEFMDEFDKNVEFSMVDRETYENDVYYKPDYREYADIRERVDKSDWTWLLSGICMSKSEMEKRMSQYEGEFSNFCSFLDEQHKLIEETNATEDKQKGDKYVKDIIAKYSDGDAHIHAEISVIKLKGDKGLYNGQF